MSGLSSNTALESGLYRNRWLLGGLSLGILLQTAVVYSETLNRLFHMVPIPPQDYLYIAAAARLVLWLEEGRKLIA